MTDERVLNRNLVFCAVGAIVCIILGIIQFSLLTHNLPQKTVGTYSLIMTWLAFIHAFSSVGGVRSIITRELTQREDTAGILTSGIAAETLLGLLAFCLSTTTVFLFGYFDQIDTELIVTTALMFLGFSTMSFFSLVHSQERIGWIILSNSIGFLVATIAMFLCLKLKLTLLWICVAHVSWRFVSGAIIFRIAKWRDNFCIAKFRLKECIDLIKAAVPVTLMLLVTQLYVRIDIVMIDYFKGKQAVALYASAYSFLDYLMMLSNSLMAAAYPRFTRILEHDREGFPKLYKKILLLFGKYLIPIAILIAIFSRFLLTTLYGDDYAPATLSLQILMIASAIAWINGPSGTIFIALKKQSLYMWGTIISLFVNIIINLLLIPNYGAAGAAIATVLTELALCSWSILLIWRLLKN